MCTDSEILDHGKSSCPNEKLKIKFTIFPKKQLLVKYIIVTTRSIRSTMLMMPFPWKLGRQFSTECAESIFCHLNRSDRNKRKSEGAKAGEFYKCWKVPCLNSLSFCNVCSTTCCLQLPWCKMIHFTFDKIGCFC